MDERDVEVAALRREIERIKQLLAGRRGAYQDLEYFEVDPDYGAPLPEEDDDA